MGADQSRDLARASAAAIRGAIADPTTAGQRIAAHIQFGGRRGGTWLTTWSKLPGLAYDARKGEFTHQLLPGWCYNARELRTEMLEDLDRLAATGELPKVATRVCGGAR